MAKLWNAEAELLRIQQERNRSRMVAEVQRAIDLGARRTTQNRALIQRPSLQPSGINYDYDDTPNEPIITSGPIAGELKERTLGAQNLENRHKHILTIQYLPAKYTVEFPAFITQFSDAYNSAWNSEKVYGRMDPMGTFMHTKRNISLAFNVPAESFEHAKQNLYRVNKLVSFLYPVYYRTKDQPIGVMNQDPFWEVTFGNLIQNSQTGGPLLGFVNGITVDPSVEDGFFNRVGPTGKAEYYPKNVRLNFEFTVMHEHQMGFEANVGSKKPIKVQGVGMMDQTVMTYKFNDPKLTFGNFPYVTDQFAASVRTSQNIIPQNSLQPPTLKAARRRGDEPVVTGPVSYYAVYMNAIENNRLVLLEDLLSHHTHLSHNDQGFNRLTMLTTRDIAGLLQLDKEKNVKTENWDRMSGAVRTNDMQLWKQVKIRYGFK